VSLELWIQQLEGVEWCHASQLIVTMAAEIGVLNEDCRTKFQYLASKFASLLHGRSEGDRQQINSLFDELNALDFKSPLVSSSDVGEIFCYKKA
jgi:hypothetical protein